MSKPGRRVSRLDGVTDLYSDLRDAPPPLSTPARALTIGAHADDAEFGAGGTLARWAAAGCEVTLLIVTDGSKGSWDPGADPGTLATLRRDEAAAAAERLGAAGVAFLDYVDGETAPTPELRRDLCSWIRRLRPDVVLTHDPWERYQLHPDHRAVGFSALDAVVAAREPLFYPDLGPGPHRPGALLLWSADAPDHWEDITATLGTKIEALLCHSSQGTTTMGGADRNESRREAFSTRVREWAASAGEATGMAAAEAFKRITP
jgi:LmbE family N-acetylglucosaminyl deacetylase